MKVLSSHGGCIIHSSLCQKMAMRDQPAMLELLQISCLIHHVWPQLQAHLGQGKALDDIVQMWEIGNLGCHAVLAVKEKS